MIVHQIKWDHGYRLGGKFTGIYLASPRVRHLCCSDTEAFRPHKIAVMSINSDPIKE